MAHSRTIIGLNNVENHISSNTKLASGDCTSPGNAVLKWDFGYDGDGVRVATVTTTYDANGNPDGSSWTSYYTFASLSASFGGAYEVRSDSTTIKYYAFAGQMVAMNDGTGLQYFLTDHLGSVVAITDATGTLISQQRYLPFGKTRTDVPSPDAPSTDYSYTAQRDLDPGMGGLMDYKARFYSPYLNRFIQPDSIIPDPSNPQAWNRFGYVHNNPINFNDPTGHKTCDEEGYCIENGVKTRNRAFDPLDRKPMPDIGTNVSVEVGQFYVGPNIPKDLNEYEESAYSGHGLANTPPGSWAIYGDGTGFLWDMTDIYSRLRNNTNVFVYANLKQYDDGTLNIVALTVGNGSDERIFIDSVKLFSKGNPMLEFVTGTCNSLDQCYYPNPPRIMPTGNDTEYFSSIDSKSIEIISLTPSGNPINPSNHFGPQGVQAVTISIYFRFTSELSHLTISKEIIP